MPGEGRCFCRGCGYDLVGLESGACPECGRAFDPGNPDTFHRHPAQFTTPMRWLIGGLAVTASVTVSWRLIRAGAPLEVILWMALIPTGIALFGVNMGRGVLRRPTSPGIVLLTLVPAATFAVVLGTLAAHMRIALGGWPRNIGQAGFPNALAVHADVAMWIFGQLLIATVAVLPIAALIAVAIRPLRPAIFPLSLCGLANLASLGIMQLYPDAFLNWWWD